MNNLKRALRVATIMGAVTVAGMLWAADAPPFKPSEMEIKATKDNIERLTQDVARTQTEAGKAVAGSPLAAAYQGYLKARQAELDYRKQALATLEGPVTREQAETGRAEGRKLAAASDRAATVLDARKSMARLADDSRFEERKAQFPAELQDKVAARAAARKAAGEAWAKVAEACGDSAEGIPNSISEIDLRRLKLKANTAEGLAQLADQALSMAGDEKRMEADLAGVLTDDIKTAKLKAIKDLSATIIASSQVAFENGAKRQEAELERQVAVEEFRRMLAEARKNAPAAPRKEATPRPETAPRPDAAPRK